jgi:hypothetical protein
MAGGGVGALWEVMLPFLQRALSTWSCGVVAGMIARLLWR